MTQEYAVRVIQLNGEPWAVRQGEEPVPTMVRSVRFVMSRVALHTCVASGHYRYYAADWSVSAGHSRRAPAESSILSAVDAVTSANTFAIVLYRDPKVPSPVPYLVTRPLVNSRMKSTTTQVPLLPIAKRANLQIWNAYYYRLHHKQGLKQGIGSVYPN